MIVKTSFHGLPVSIVTEPSKIRGKITEAKMLYEIEIYEADFDLKICALDGSAFDTPNGQKQEINVKLSSLDFEFTPTEKEDRITIAEITVHKNNLTMLHSIKRFPNLLSKCEADFLLCVIGAYLISSKQAPKYNHISGTWNEAEHTADSWIEFNIGN